MVFITGQNKEHITHTYKHMRTWHINGIVAQAQLEKIFHILHIKQVRKLPELYSIHSARGAKYVRDQAKYAKIRD
jgi:hypothetical protein